MFFFSKIQKYLSFIANPFDGSISVLLSRSPGGASDMRVDCSEMQVNARFELA